MSGDRQYTKWACKRFELDRFELAHNIVFCSEELSKKKKHYVHALRVCGCHVRYRCGAAFPVIFHCSNASEMISIADNKRSWWSIYISNYIQAERKRPLLLRHIILGTPNFMHHVGSTLSLMCFMKRAYKGKSEPNISHWREMLCTHTKVYIFLLKNNYSPSRPFVSGRFDKARMTIHHNEWKETLWIFSVLYFSIFSHSQRCWIFGFEKVVICNLWFMIFWAWKTNLSCMCKYFTAGKKKKKILLYDAVIYKVQQPCTTFLPLLKPVSRLQSFCIIEGTF